MSKPSFIFNLKADLSLDDCIDFINALTENGEKKFQNLFVALPFFRLKEMCTRFPDSGITFGCAMLNRAEESAFTGPVAAKMVKDAHGQFVLIGTADERNVLQVSNEGLRAKLRAALVEDLKPILCIGAGVEQGDDALKQQLEILAESEIFSKDAHPIVVFELPFKTFAGYLPTPAELKAHAERFNGLLRDVFSESCEKIVTFAALPSDLVGFSELLPSSPFNGAFFTKSGVYPHTVHKETLNLFHVECSGLD